MKQPHYNHDMAHCEETSCHLHDQCYRGWLFDHMQEGAYTFSPEPNQLGRECEYYQDKENY